MVSKKSPLGSSFFSRIDEELDGAGVSNILKKPPEVESVDGVLVGGVLESPNNEPNGFELCELEVSSNMLGVFLLTEALIEIA
jgi:hypothetical protein